MDQSYEIAKNFFLENIQNPSLTGVLMIFADSDGRYASYKFMKSDAEVIGLLEIWKATILKQSLDKASTHILNVAEDSDKGQLQ